MKEVDYIVVGLGIAGFAICERFEQAGKSFVVIDTPKTNSSIVAGGIMNPVVLKRFTQAWRSPEFRDEAIAMYASASEKLEGSFLAETGIQRIFNNAQEQNDWMVASETAKLSPFLNGTLSDRPHREPLEETTARVVHTPFGLGDVKGGYRVATVELLSAYRSYLNQTDRLIANPFHYDDLELNTGSVHYKNWKARRILFAEGAIARNNPYFMVECLIPKKGEYIIVKAPELRLKSILKGSCFVISLGNDLYKVGATFDHHSLSYETTPEGKEQLVATLRKLISCPFEVVDQIAGMRPTVKDRRPLLGMLEHENVIFFNGLGARGIMMAPLLSKWLFDFLENDIPLPEAVNIKRFWKS